MPVLLGGLIIRHVLFNYFSRSGSLCYLSMNMYRNTRHFDVGARKSNKNKTYDFVVQHHIIFLVKGLKAYRLFTFS